MALVLIAFTTREGHTAKVVGRMRDVIERGNHAATLVALAEDPDAVVPPDADAVIVGGSIHGGRHADELVAFARRNRERLETLPSALFTICLTAADDTHEARVFTAGVVERFIDATGWSPARSELIAGCLAWHAHDLLTRTMLRLVQRETPGAVDRWRDYDYTDWSAVERLATDVAAAASRARARADREPDRSTQP